MPRKKSPVPDLPPATAPSEQAETATASAPAIEFTEVALPTPILLRLSPYEIQAPEELNTRRFQTSRESILSLAHSMLEDGQQEPIGVIQLPDSTYLLKFGWRRWQAGCIILEEGMERDYTSDPYTLLALVTPASVPTKNCPTPDLIAGIVENTQRESLGPVDQAYAIKILADSGVRQRSIAHRMNLDQSVISDRLRLLGLPTDVQRVVNTGEMSISSAMALLNPPDTALPAYSAGSFTPEPEPAPEHESDTDVRNDGNSINTDSNVLNQDSVAKAVKPNKTKTVKQIVAELHEYSTPEDYDPKVGRTEAQTWVLTKLIPWINTGKRRFQAVMEALEVLNRGVK